MEPARLASDMHANLCIRTVTLLLIEGSGLSSWRDVPSSASLCLINNSTIATYIPHLWRDRGTVMRPRFCFPIRAHKEMFNPRGNLFALRYALARGSIRADVNN
jgi:hypothetical protein